jgi:hypothetical protein
LQDSGVLDSYKYRIIASDGGPGHFKVYKTQYWMSKYCFHDFLDNLIFILKVGFSTKWE